MEKWIYVADDEQNIREMMKIFLENEGYHVRVFKNGTEIRAAVAERKPDMIILDVMMPGEDGFSLCTAFRKELNIPIMIVSAKDSPMDRITGFTLGSDDYIPKPFLLPEFLVRVKALFRRAELSVPQANPQPESYSCGNLKLCPRQHSAFIGAEPLPLTPMEYSFLLYMMAREDAAVSKEALLKDVWECRELSEDQRMPDDLVKRLRRKLRERHASVKLETVWGYGYRLTTESDVSRGDVQ